MIVPILVIGAAGGLYMLSKVIKKKKAEDPASEPEFTVLPPTPVQTTDVLNLDWNPSPKIMGYVRELPLAKQAQVQTIITGINNSMEQVFADMRARKLTLQAADEKSTALTKKGEMLVTGIVNSHVANSYTGGR